MLLDFSEIPSAGGDPFEAFVYEFLQIYGYLPDTPPSFGPDGGRDCIVREPGFGMAQHGRRWLVSCKHKQSRIGLADDRADHRKLTQFRCDGFILAYSNVMTTSVQETYEALRRDYGVPYIPFGPYDLERHIVSDVKYAGLVRRFMPQSFDRLYAIREAMTADCCEAFNAGMNNRYAIVWSGDYGSTNFLLCCENCMGAIESSLESSGIPYGSALVQEAPQSNW